MTAALTALGGLGIGALLCEGGGRLAASLVRDGLVDELAWFSAGAILGSGSAPAVSDFGIEGLDQMPRFRRIAAEPVGGDILSVWHP
jgi:diaminohydroxyphosphoribosylaminopyrimidine deaminase/5-amino-6-(5-phosphoribosylamino)uracil reductase